MMKLELTWPSGLRSAISSGCGSWLAHHRWAPARFAAQFPIGDFESNPVRGNRSPGSNDSAGPPAGAARKSDRIRRPTHSGADADLFQRRNNRARYRATAQRRARNSLRRAEKSAKSPPSSADADPWSSHRAEFPPLAAAAKLAIGARPHQCLADRVSREVMHELGPPEADFDLRGMHVDVHFVIRHFRGTAALRGRLPAGRYCDRPHGSHEESSDRGPVADSQKYRCRCDSGAGPRVAR